MDPDGVITEIAIDFGDGGFAWATAFCDPEETSPGEPMTMQIPYGYQPGKYIARVWAYSSPGCIADTFQESRPDVGRIKIS